MILILFTDRKTDEELLTIRTAKNRFSHTPSELVLHVWTRDCPEVYQYQVRLVKYGNINVIMILL